MKTAMQKAIDDLRYNKDQLVTKESIANYLKHYYIIEEKQDIIDAYNSGFENNQYPAIKQTGIEYYKNHYKK